MRFFLKLVGLVALPGPVRLIALKEQIHLFTFYFLRLKNAFALGILASPSIHL